MEKDTSVRRGGSFKKEPLKKQLSFDEKVTEIRLMGLTSDKNAEEEEVRKQSVKWWDPSGNNPFTNFCKSTSIHGLQYVGTTGMHLGERILWGVVFLLSAIASIYFIKAVFDKYYDSPVVVTFDSTEMFIGEVPFPAVTLCNMNRVLRSKATEYMRVASENNDTDERVQNARKNVYYLDHVCSVSNIPFSKMFNYSMKRGSVDKKLLSKVRLDTDDEKIEDVRDFLRNASQPCSKMIQLCMWEGDAMKCEDVFRPIETNFGKCCVFNMIPHSILNVHIDDSRDSSELLERWRGGIKQNAKIEDLLGNKYKFPRHQNRAGKASGLMILADPALDEYFCTSSDSTGFRLSVHFATDIPHVNDFGIAIRPNYEHFVSVTPSVTKADKTITSYSTDKRKCYVDGEFDLKYYSIYTVSNCMDECIANMTYNECQCVRYYMPRDDSRDICRPSQFACAEGVRRKTFKSGVKEGCQMCLPTCTEVRYSASVTMAPLQRLDLWIDENNKPAPWAKKNISIINVYFGEDSTYPKIRSQLFGITDLISQTGGLLGLCMGFSLLSLFEIIYHVTCRPWCHKKAQTTNTPDAESNNPPSLNVNGVNGHSLHQDVVVAEARRVHMKPGDDGLYHLQNPRYTTPPPTPPLFTASVIPEEDERIETEKSDNAECDDVEDSHL